MNKRVLMGAALLVAGFGQQASAANLVLDGGFELPATGHYTGSLGDGWSATSNVIDIGAVGPAWTPGVPRIGNQFAYLDDGNTVNTLSQTLATVIGQTYLVQYWVADTNPDVFSVRFDGQVLFSGVAPTNGVNLASDYVSQSFVVTATSTSSDLTFTGQFTSGGYGTIIDDVTVDVFGATVPEPATVGFTSVGLFSLLAIHRSRVRHLSGPWRRL